MATHAPSLRLEARLPREVDELLRMAVELQGTTRTSFVIEAVMAAAQEVIQRNTVLRLSLADQERFAHAILEPPAPNEALQRAFARRRVKLARA
jgi:uncharacterized protein (DUF1778 family)